MILNSKIYVILIAFSMFISACSSILQKDSKVLEVPKKEKVTKKAKVALEVKSPKIEIIEDKIVKKNDINESSSNVCKKEENKYNLIVNAPENSKIRILNIKPKYKKCIALKKGKYHLEVTKKSYKQYRKWIEIDKNTQIDISLEKQKQKVYNFDYNLKNLENILKHSSSQKIRNKAKKRIEFIKNNFDSYSPKDIIGKESCQGFYPKMLVNDMLNTHTKLKDWDSIRWSGSCKNGLMDSRGVIYFISKNALVDLKGKMKNGFFEGKVYNFSRSSKDIKDIKGLGRGTYKIKLKSYNDFKKYQQ